MKQNISLEEARNILENCCQKSHLEYLHLPDALGRILAQDIAAKENIPPFDRSPLDGYAFMAEDTINADKQNPVVLKVMEEVPAGYTATKKVISGTAIKVMTGAPIPEGANAVEKFENIKREGQTIEIFKSFKSGQNIIRAGEDVQKGQHFIKSGRLLTPPTIGLLASLGVDKVPVYKRPKVALVSTGDELVDISESLRPGKIRNSNIYSLQAYCTEVGAEPLILGNAKDRIGEVAAFIEEGLKQADMVITTGGVSVGDYDVVMEAVKSIDADILFWKLDIKPGMATMAAVKEDKLILSLSGNPASGLIVFQLLGIPFIRKMAGWSTYLLPTVAVQLQQDFLKASPKRRFLRGKLTLEDGTVGVTLTGNQGNAILSSMIDCNVLVEIPAGTKAVKAGTKWTAHIVDHIY